jgi:VanZ family protein
VRRWRWDGPTRLLGLAFGSLVLFGDVVYLAAQGLGPFEFHARPGGVQLLASVEWVPFRSYTANLTPALVGDFFLKVARYVVFGIVLSLGLPGRDGRRFPRRAAVVTIVAALFSAAVEFAQLFVVSRFSDVSDVLIAAMGAFAGAVAVQWYEDSVRDARLRAQREAASAPTLGARPGARGLRTRWSWRRGGRDVHLRTGS